MRTRSSAMLFAILTFFVASGAATAQQTATTQGPISEITSDFKYAANNAVMDGEDIVTSPLYIASPDSALRSPRFYLMLAGAGAIFGGSFALDQTMRSHLR